MTFPCFDWLNILLHLFKKKFLFLRLPCSLLYFLRWHILLFFDIFIIYSPSFLLVIFSLLLCHFAILILISSFFSITNSQPHQSFPFIPSSFLHIAFLNILIILFFLLYPSTMPSCLFSLPFLPFFIHFFVIFLLKFLFSVNTVPRFFAFPLLYMIFNSSIYSFFPPHLTS